MNEEINIQSILNDLNEAKKFISGMDNNNYYDLYAQVWINSANDKFKKYYSYEIYNTNGQQVV